MKFFSPFIILVMLLFYLYQKGIIFSNFDSLSPQQAMELLQKDGNNTIILDVRTPEEYQNDGHLTGAVLMPLQTLDSDMPKLEKFKDKKILVYCRSGTRSVSASRKLNDAGYKVVNMDGGINGWKSSGYKVE